MKKRKCQVEDRGGMLEEMNDITMVTAFLSQRHGNRAWIQPQTHPRRYDDHHLLPGPAEELPQCQTTDFQKDSDHFLFIRKSWEVLPAQPLTGGEPQEVTWRRRRSQGAGVPGPYDQNGGDPPSTSSCTPGGPHPGPLRGPHRNTRRSGPLY
ncbi:unnamed protein product [Boreogadus saida]